VAKNTRGPLSRLLLGHYYLCFREGLCPVLL
jgi:hypothetical protein